MLRAIAVLGAFTVLLSGCETGEWVDVPIPLSCEQLTEEAMSEQKELWGKSACVAREKSYTGEARCDGVDELQVRCE